MSATATHATTVGPPADRKGRTAFMVVFAAFAHLATFAAFPEYVPPELRELVTLNLEVIEPEPEPELEPLPEPEPEPEPEEVVPEPEPEPEPVRPPPRPRPRNEPPPPPPPDDEPPPPPPPPAPIDFPDVLTSEGNSGGSTFVVPATQAPTMGPIRSPRAGTGMGDRADGQEGGTGTGMGPVVVALSDLSRAPEAPTGVAACLEENYPRQAKQQGVEGTARVRLRVSPSGRASRIRVRSESVDGFGFGAACRRCLSDRRWSPPLDQEGQPVATTVPFRCQFRIR